MLLWLRDMGADEGVADSPINRFAEKPPAPKPAVVPQPVRLAAPAEPVRVQLPADASLEVVHAAARAATTVSGLQALLDQFDAHPLKKTASNACFLGGAGASRILVIADRPRTEEDRSGKIFADRHEVLAERMLAAIGLRAEAEGEMEQVSLLGFIPWRPPGNRPPNEMECRMILPFAERAVHLLQPRLILSLGALPGQWLAGATDTIQKQRGRWMAVGGIPMISTFHPETLLKSPASKRLAWHDLLALREKLDSLT
jgi:uracil-DNA glycosylase